MVCLHRTTKPLEAILDVVVAHCIVMLVASKATGRRLPIIFPLQLFTHSPEVASCATQHRRPDHLPTCVAQGPAAPPLLRTHHHHHQLGGDDDGGEHRR
jgi:hypothetical protein